MLDRLLHSMSSFNDRVQALLFNPNRLAPTYAASQMTNPFPFNAFYGIDDAPDIDGNDWKLEVTGLVSDETPGPWNDCAPCRSRARSPG